MTHARKTTQATGRAMLLAPFVAMLLAAPLAFGTPMEVSEVPARDTASSSGTLSNSVSGPNTSSSIYTQVQMTPDRASLFNATNGPVNGRSVVPEPGTLILVGLGLLGVAAARRR